MADTDLFPEVDDGTDLFPEVAAAPARRATVAAATDGEEEVGLSESLFRRAQAGVVGQVGGLARAVGESIAPDIGTLSPRVQAIVDMMLPQRAVGEAVAGGGAEAVDLAQAYRQEAGGVRPDSLGDALTNPANTARYYGGILSEFVPTTAAAMMAGGPTAAATLIGASTGGQTYGDLRASGVGQRQALGEAVTAGVMEAAGGVAPLEAAMGPGRFVPRAARAALGESLSEAATEGVQTTTPALMGREPVRAADIVSSMVDAGIVGAPTGVIEAAAGSGRPDVDAFSSLPSVAEPVEAPAPPDLFPEVDVPGSEVATTATPVASEDTPPADDNTRFMRPTPDAVEPPVAQESPPTETSALPSEVTTEVEGPLPGTPAVAEAPADPVVAESAKARAQRLFSDHSPETPVITRRKDESVGLEFGENRLTRRALDEVMATPDRSVRELLETVAEQPDLEDADRWLAHKIAPLADKLGVRLIDPSPEYKYAGAYDPTNNSLWIRQAKPDIILHEALHGVTSALLKNKAVTSADPTLRRVTYEFDSLLSHLQSELAFGNIDRTSLPVKVRAALDDKLGPLSNTRELLTYGMTDKPFREWLKTIPAPPGRADVRNMWEAFKQAIISAFGKVTPAQRSFLDALIESTGELVDTAEANPELVRQALPETARTPAATPPNPPQPPADSPTRVSTPPPTVAPTNTKNAVMQREREAEGSNPIDKGASSSNGTTIGMGEEVMREKSSRDTYPTSIKNSQIDRERAERGASPLKSSYKSDDDLLSEGRAEIERNNSAAFELIDRIMAVPGSPISDRDTAIMQVHWNDLSAQLNRAADMAVDGSLSDGERDAAVNRFNELSQKAFTAQEAYRMAGTTTARALAFRRRMLDDQFTLSAMERSLSVATGNKLSLAQKHKIKSMYDDIAKKQANLDETQKKLDDQLAGADVQATYQQLLKDMASAMAKKPSIAVLKSRAAESRKALKAMAVESAVVVSDDLDPAALTGAEFIHLANIGAYHVAAGANTQASFDKAMREDVGTAYDEALPEVFEAAKMQAEAANPTPKQALAAVDPQKLTHRDVYDLAMAHVRKGVHGADAVMKAVFNDLKETVPDLTERKVRQLFSEYGKAKFPSKDADKKELREIRALVQLQESIDRAEAGLKPLKSGLQRDKATAEIMAKRARLNELLRQQEIKAAPTPEKIAGYQQARAINLKKQIEALDRMLFTGERDGKRVKLPDNAETSRLAALRDTLRAELRQVDRDADSARREFESAKRREDRAIQRIQDEIARIESGLPKEAKEPGKPRSSAVQAKLDELESLRKKERKMRAEQLSAQREAEKIPSHEREAQRDADRRERSEQLAAQREAEKVPYSPEHAYQKMRATSIARQLDEIKARISANDYERREVRPPRTLNEANQKNAFELAKAKEAFLRYQFEQEMSRRSPLSKAFGFGRETLNLARAIMTSFDLSAVLRQGGFIAVGNPIRAAKSIGPMLKAFASEQAQHAVKDEIAKRPNASLYKRAGLELTEEGGTSLSKMEEAFMSRWVEKIPKAIGGGFVRGSQRAFVTFLNKLRADSFDAMYASLVRNGEKPTEAELKAIGGYINVATGRGKIGLTNNAAVGLNTVFFAPKLVASRFNLLAGQPLYGGSMRTRKLIAMEYARYLTGVSVIMGLGYLAHLATKDEDDDKPFINFDPRSSDFLKMRFGRTFIDPMSGIAQVATFLGREISGESVTGSGAVRPLRKEWKLANLFRDPPNYDKPESGGGNAFDVATSFARTKLAPVPGAIVNMFTGEDMEWQLVTPTSTLTSLVTPLSMQNVKDVMTEHGVPGGAAITALELLGMGVQYRDPAKMAAADYKDMTPKQRKVYGDYEVASKALKAKVEQLQEYANKLPPDTAAVDLKQMVTDKSRDLGLGDITADTYKANTTSRNKETGERMRGAKRNDSGGVRLNSTKSEEMMQLRATEKVISKIETNIERIKSEQLSKAALEKMPTSYVSGEMTKGDPNDPATDAEKDFVIKAMQDERAYQQELFLKNMGFYK